MRAQRRLGAVGREAQLGWRREVISLAVRWYLRNGLSYRDAEELRAGRWITVDHVTVYQCVQRFTSEFIEAARPAATFPGTAGSSTRPT